MRSVAGRPVDFEKKHDCIFGNRLITIIRSAPDQYFVISYTGPIDSRDRAERLYGAVLGSFKLLEDEKSDKAVQDGLVRTRQWLEKMRSTKLADKLQPPLFLRVS